MKYVDFNGRKLSRIILGGDYYGRQVSESDVYKLIDKFVELGGNFFDTARLYTAGQSEEIYGKWLNAHRREDYFLATKGGCREVDGVKESGISEAEIIKDLDDSLNALKLSYVDLYYLHRDDENIPVSEVMEYMNKFVSEGKIKNIGVSNWKAQRIKEANEYADKHNLVPITFSQIKYSLAASSPSYIDEPGLVEMNDEEYKFYSKNNIIVSAFASQSKGFFSKIEKYGAAGLDEKTKTRYLCEENLEKYKNVKETAEKYNICVSAVSLNYLTSKSVVILPIVGCKNESQLVDSLKGTDITFTEDEVKKLERV